MRLKEQSTSREENMSDGFVAFAHFHLLLLQKPSNDETATLRVWTSNFKLYNVNVINSFGKGSQALALSANAAVSGKTSPHLPYFPILTKNQSPQGQGYYGCSFEG